MTKYKYFYCRTFNGSLFGEGIDNALVEINAPEIQSRRFLNEFVEAIRSVGTKEQSHLKNLLRLKIEIKDGEKSISIEPSNNDLIIDFEIIYKNLLLELEKNLD